MQRLHTHRIQVRPPASSRQAGFTLIELMVTIAVVAVISAVAFAGFRANDYRTQYTRFVDDVQGLIITARDTAIDRQTRTEVLITGDSVTVNRFDQANNTWVLVDLATVTANAVNRDLLEANNNVCIYGVFPGVQTPEQAEANPPPNSCASTTFEIQFEPDGSFTDRNNDFSAIDNAGATIWIADEKPAAPRISIVQVFPGGLIRAFEDVQ